MTIGLQDDALRGFPGYFVEKFQGLAFADTNRTSTKCQHSTAGRTQHDASSIQHQPLYAQYTAANPAAVCHMMQIANLKQL